MIIMRIYPVITFVLVFLTATGCGEDEIQVDCQNITRDTADDCIRMNQIQVLGTHNSYKLAPADTLVELLDSEQPGWADNILYEHRPLHQQLGRLGIRQLELDIFADPEGGLYAEPAGALLAGDEPFIGQDEMLQPGFKVLHSQDVDYRTTCLTFTSCLAEVRDWSFENPSHLPILILVEVKDRPISDRGGISFVEPIQVDESLIFKIDEEIWSVFTDDHIITPDDVRGDFTSLEEAILTDGWPTLAQSRGRIYFGLDNTGGHRDAYLSKSPDLSGRALFVSSEPGEPSGAFIKMNNAINSYEQIKERVEAGYIIRTRSDIPLNEARTGDTTRLVAALASGAQHVSTDYPEPSPFGSGYIVELPDVDGPGRCNPVSAPPTCLNKFITE